MVFFEFLFYFEIGSEKGFEGLEWIDIVVDRDLEDFVLVKSVNGLSWR